MRGRGRRSRDGGHVLDARLEIKNVRIKIGIIAVRAYIFMFTRKFVLRQACVFETSLFSQRFVSDCMQFLALLFLSMTTSIRRLGEQLNC